jgi:hypothetical protein
LSEMAAGLRGRRQLAEAGKRGSMKRLVTLVGVLVLGALLFTPAVGAEKPVRSFIPAEDLTLSGVCPFEVGVEILENREFGTTFSDGRFLITGTLKVEITNLDEPENSLTVNVSGPGVFTPTADGGFVIKAEGNWFWFFFPGDLGKKSPGTALLTSGLTTLVVSGSGDLTFTPARNATDICAELA